MVEILETIIVDINASILLCGIFHLGAHLQVPQKRKQQSMALFLIVSKENCY